LDSGKSGVQVLPEKQFICEFALKKLAIKFEKNCLANLR
jgi:hypothetical protein